MDKLLLFLLSANSKTRDQLKNALKSEFEVVSHSTAESLLSELRKQRPHGIVMDLSVKDKPPFYIIDKVRNSPATRGLEFVIVSRDASKENLEKAVRAGVSHFIGIPFEKDVLLEKIRIAFGAIPAHQVQNYFSLENESKVKVVSYGRISYISKEGIHFECRLRLAPDDELYITSPLSQELGLQGIKLKVTGTSQDVYYNYPSAVDAAWVDEKQKKLIGSWVTSHRELNSPKKTKILFIHPELNSQREFLNQTNQTHYSVRFANHIDEALESFNYMKPACVVIHSKEWTQTSSVLQSKIQDSLVKLNAQWIFVQDEDSEPPDQSHFKLLPGFSPPQISATVMAVEKLCPILPADPDKLYFSKTLEDSRLKIYFFGKTLELGETGCRLALEFEPVPPCNLQLDMKSLSKQNLRNPYVRAWPPVMKLSGDLAAKEKLRFGVMTHFLGIDDHHGQALRLFIREAEMKERIAAVAAIAPKMGDEPAPADESSQDTPPKNEN
ncbi:MAG: hypothetical protein COV44_00265 [Deltaproteobacteria bacterium CG11_big_fil_rev_8_21_14_0_20_45_16]|nr:MAG: hypothetical protein COV44_00265 [Deltaproteobacteria bacterium CG11_big_fil_rev_8_21_14_0_20_45_16]